MKKYKVIALIGEAGSGKDFLLRQAIQAYPQYNEIISCTTRPIREGEVNGKNYYFLTDKEFKDFEKDGYMLETASFNGWYYGTMKQALRADSINIGVFNPEGVRSLIKHEDIDVRVFYVRAPAKKRLLRQLNRENNPNVDEIVRRYSTDQADFAELDFPYENLPNRFIEDVDDAMRRLSFGQKGLND